MINIKKIGLGVGAVATVIAPLATVVSCGMENSADSWIGSHTDLNTTQNTKNTSFVTAFSFEGSRTNVGTATLSMNQVQSNLIGTFVVEKPTISTSGYITDKTDKDFGKLIDPISSPTVYRSLELVQKIILTVGNKKVVFDEDGNLFDKSKAKDLLEKLPSLPTTVSKNINSKYFLAQLEHATDIEFELRDTNYVDHNGVKTKYKVTPQDYLATFRASNFQYIVKDAVQLDGGKYKNDFYTAAKYFNTKRGGQFPTSDDDIQNTDNRYLWNIAGIDVKQLAGLKTALTMFTEAELTTANSLIVKEKTNAIHLTLKPGAVHSLLWNKLLNSEVVHYTPRPIEFIKEQNKESWAHEHNVPQESSLAKLGMFTYGENYKKMLYVGSYYVSHNGTFMQKIVKNKHYWNKDFVNSSETVNSHTINFRTQDATLWPINQYNKFMQGVEYSLSATEVEQMTPPEQREVYSHSKTMQYSFDLPTTSSGNQLMTTINPIGKIKDSPYMNDDFTKVMYGHTREELSKGANTLKAQFTTGLAFKSQLAALINWYTIKENSGGHGDVWNFFTPSGAKFADPAGGSSKTANKLIKKRIDYYRLKGAGVELAGSVDFEKNKQIFEGKQTAKLKSAKYNEVVIELKKLFEHVFPTGNHKIAFTWPVRSAYRTKQQQNTYEELAKFIEKVDLGSRFSFKINELDGLPRHGYSPDFSKNIMPAAIASIAIGTFQGWGADTSEGVSWYVGATSPGGRGVTPLLQTLSLLGDNNASDSVKSLRDASRLTFPQATKVAKEIEDQFDKGLKKVRNEITNDHDAFLTKAEWEGIKDKDGNRVYMGDYDKSIVSLKEDIANMEFSSFHDLNNLDVVNAKNSFGIIGLRGKGILKKKYISELSSESSVWISNAIFKYSSPFESFNAQELLDLELEFRNISGYTLTFASGFVIPTARKPKLSFIKPWITFKPQRREGVAHLEEWRIK